MISPVTQTIPDGVQPQVRMAREADRLRTLVADTDKVIMDIRSVFPFQLFPDSIIIDTNKVTIVRRKFLYKRTIPILLEDILTLKVTRSLLCASMEFEVRAFEQNPSPITHIWPDHAAASKQLILGLMKARREKINLSLFTPDEIRSNMMRIGRSSDDADSGL